ncbi:MAG: transporter [Bdellovibrionales bacterium]|nr:transporter [Bdellovibrionales bacterium]
MKLLLAVVLTVFSMMSFAQTRIVSIDAFDMAYSGGLSFKHDEGKDDDRDTTTFKFNVNYAQNLEQYVGLMWKAQVYWNRIDEDFGGDRLTSEFGVGGGMLYNFQPDDIKNSIMAGAVIGLERATYELQGKDDEAGFNLFLNLEAGKRWDLGSYSVANISYAPTISLNFKRYGGDIRDEYFKNSRELRFNFLKFDILF